MPTNSVYPLGKGLFGAARLGDESTVSLVPRQNALALSYTVTYSKYGVALPLSYTLERRTTAPLLLYYLITPPSSFAINGDGTIIKPDSITYTPRSVTARTLLGGPVLQGYSVMIWNYSVLQWPEFSQIVQYYNSQSPLVTLTYPDEHGTWCQRQVVMLPPQYGSMTLGQVVTGVSFFFTRLF